MCHPITRNSHHRESPGARPQSVPCWFIRQPPGRQGLGLATKNRAEPQAAKIKTSNIPTKLLKCKRDKGVIVKGTGDSDYSKYFAFAYKPSIFNGSRFFQGFRRKKKAKHHRLAILSQFSLELILYSTGKPDMYGGTVNRQSLRLSLKIFIFIKPSI